MDEQKNKARRVSFRYLAERIGGWGEGPGGELGGAVGWGRVRRGGVGGCFLVTIALISCFAPARLQTIHVVSTVSSAENSRVGRDRNGAFLFVCASFVCWRLLFFPPAICMI